MRNKIAALIAASLLACAATLTVNARIDQQDVPAEANCRNGQCTAIAKSTKQRCKSCVSNPGDAYCWSHTPRY